MPAPVGGLNARESIAAMPPTDAYAISNWFPSTSALFVRNGSSDWVTGITGVVETLACYSPASGVRKLFAAAGANIYDATAQGAVGAPVVTGNTSARWQFVNFANPAGQWLYMVNGQDNPQLYDGTTWQAVTNASAPISITGSTDPLTSYITVTNFKGRLYFIAKNTFHVWYLGVNAVGGPATLFDMSSLFKLGGSLMTCFPWSLDTVAGPQDYMAFVSTEGEVVVFQGYDPSQVGSWSQLGTFRMGRPVGRRCYCKIGSDVSIICADGLIPLSQEMLTDRAQQSVATTDKIRNAILSDFQNYNSHFGWQVILHPIGSKLLVNVPQVENNLEYQYVMNTITQAWTRYDGWNASCFELSGDSLYYGTNGKVVLCDAGTTDNGAPITTYLAPAYSYFDSPAQNKQFTMVRPTISSDGTIGITVALSVDYRPVNVTSVLALPPSPGVSFWDVSFWDVSYWSSGQAIRLNWETISGVGYAASLNMKTISNVDNVQLIAIDYAYQLGGVL